MVNFYSGFIEPSAARIMQEMFELDREFRTRYPEDEDYHKACRQWQEEHPILRGDVHTVIDHIDHIVEIAGIDHVGIGSDYDGIGTVPEQLDDVSCYPNITQALLDRGYDEAHIRKILGGNLLRVLAEAQASAGGTRSA
jgi:membrane dipeptidase